MFSKVFSSALTLQIGEHSFQFKSTQELEFVLTGRTTLSAQRAASIVGLSDSDLIQEADTFRRMESLVAEALAQAAEDPDTVDHFLSELDHSLVEEDNNWRDLLLALSQADSRYAAFKLTAISGYRAYLNAGQELVAAVFAERRQGLPDPSVVNALLGEPKARQRLVFSITDILGHEPAKLEFTRLPKAEPVAVDFGVHQSLSLMLAKHKFILVSGEPWLLIDPTGNESRLYGVIQMPMSSFTRDIARSRANICSFKPTGLTRCDSPTHRQWELLPPFTKPVASSTKAWCRDAPTKLAT